MHPHLCMIRAGEMLDTLPEKWDPRAKQPDDRLTQAIQPAYRPETSPGIPFETCLTSDSKVADIFRIFATGKVCNQLYLPQDIATPTV